MPFVNVHQAGLGHVQAQITERWHAAGATEGAALGIAEPHALFPALAALVSLYGLFADPATIGQHLNDLSRVRAALDPVHGNREFSDA